MGKTISIAIQTTLDDKGLTAAQKAIRDLMKVSKAPTGLAKAAAADAQALSKMTTAANSAATSSQKLATAQQQTALAAQKVATEEQRTVAAVANAASAQNRAEKSALSLAQAQSKAADSGNYFKNVGNAVKDSLLGVVAPAAAVATAINVAKGAVQSFADAIKLKADLDATTMAINAQIKGVRDQSQVWDQAAAFAQKFKLTQQETTEAISASIGVMRASKAPVEDILGVLARMQVLSPEQSLQEAAIALKALASGDTTSLVTRFEVSRDVANQMKQEIQGGADAVAVMSKFLKDTGIDMDVLKAKTQGVSGAMKDLEIAQEQLQLAQARWAEGPGLTILKANTTGLLSVTKQLEGNFQAVDDANRIFLDTLMRTGSITEALTVRNAALTGSLQDGGSAAATAAAAHRDNAQGIADAIQATTEYSDVIARRLTSDLDTTSEAAKMHATALVKLADELQATSEAGAQALGQSTATAVSFLGTLETQTREHEDRILALTQDRAQAKTKAQRQSIDERIAAENDGFDRQQQAAAVAYAEEQAAQQQHLGQMLIDYVNTQVQMGEIAATRGAELTAAIAAEYGVQEDLASKTFGEMTAIIDSWSESGQGSAKAIASALGTTGQAAVETKAKMDALAHKYEAELIQNFRDGKIDADQLTAALAKIPRRVYSEVITNYIERRTVDTSAPRSQQRHGGEADMRAGGGPVSMGKPYLVGEEGPELVVFNKPGRVIPAAASRQLMRSGLADGGPIGQEPGGLGDTIIWAIINGTKNQKGQLSALKQYQHMVEQAAVVVGTINDIRKTLAAPQPVLRPEDIQALANDAALVTKTLADNVVPATRLQANQLMGYVGEVEKVVSALRSVTSLRKEVADAEQPIDPDVILGLAAEARTATKIVLSLMVDGKKQQETLTTYASMVSDSVGALRAVSDLRGALREPQQPLDPDYLYALAIDTQKASSVVKSLLIPYTDDTTAQIERYQQAVSGGAQALKDIADLRKVVSEPNAPLDPDQLYRLAIDTQRASGVVKSLLVPYSEEQADQIGRYSDAVSSSVSALKSVSELSAKMFTDYTSPTDAQIGMLAKDADRITRAIATAATTYDTKGLEATKLFNEAVGGTFANIKDGLLAMQALSSGDFELKPASLAKFEQASVEMIATVGRLSSVAKAIPAADLTALGAVSSAITSQADALIRMAAVPYGNLPAASAGFAGSGGAMGGINVMPGAITVNALPGMDVGAIASAVIDKLNQQATSRR